MVINKVDVICEHKSDGSIIPLRFKILDEDGAYTTNDCLYVSRDANIYECKIYILGYKKFVRLYYFTSTSQ